MSTRNDFDGRVAVITGGASGIGLATARLFAERGARVVVLDHRAEAVETAVAGLEEAGYDARGLAIDVTDEAEIERGFAGLAADSGLDILVNNAGIAIRRPTLELSTAEWDKVIAVNQTGIFICSKAAARHMRSSSSIVNLASIMGFSGGGIYPNISYQASKGAVVNMTRALAVEWAPRGIRVNAVAPTWVRTDLTQALFNSPDLMQRALAMTPLGRLAEAGEVAEAIAFLASPAASMITGHTLPVDGGFLAQ